MKGTLDTRPIYVWTDEHIRVWYCYALMCLKDLSHKDILTINNYYLQKSVKLIFVKDYSDLATKLDDLFI